MSHQRLIADCQLPSADSGSANRQSAVANRQSPDVSVCIVNWNCRALLKRCLESLCELPQGVHLEVIVVDNGSTDGAAEMTAVRFPNVVLIRNQKNLGFSRANNQAAARARGRFLFFLNNDTFVPAGAIRDLLDFAEAHPEIGMIGPRLRNGDGRLQASYRRRPTLATFLHRTTLVRSTGLCKALYNRCRRDHFDPESIREVEVLLGAALFVRRAAFFSAGGWDEDFAFGGEDLDLCDRIGRLCPVVYFPKVEIVHYGRASTRQNIEFAAPQIVIGFLRYLRKAGCSRWALLAYKALVTLDIPVQMLEKSAQYTFRRLCGRRDEARKSWRVVRGLWHFLRRGLVPFWKA